MNPLEERVDYFPWSWTDEDRDDQVEWQKALTENWIDDVDKEFRFVLHAQLAADDDSDSKLLAELDGLPENFSAQVAGIVLVCDPDSVRRHRQAVKSISRQFPVCIDAGRVDFSSSGIEAFCSQEEVSAAWYPAVQPSPLPSGNILIALISDETLPEQRKIISEIDDWISGSRRAGLFNTSYKDAPVKAQETRILAELMGV